MKITKKVEDRIKTSAVKFKKVLEAAKNRDLNESDTVAIITDMLAEASSMAAVVASRPALELLAEHVQRANDAIASALPRNCRSLITCISSGEQFVLNLLLRGDSTALRLAKLARPLSVPLRQLILLCSQKLHEQLTVGC